MRPHTEKTLSRIAYGILIAAAASLVVFVTLTASPQALLTMACMGAVGITLTIAGEEKTYDGIKQLREAAGELRDKIKQLADKFNARKAKRDAGEEVELWPDKSKEEWERSNSDLDTLNRAIAEEEDAAAVASRIAANQRDNDSHSGGEPGTQRTQTRTMILPATARQHGRLRAFRGQDAELDAFAVGQWARGILLGDPQARQWCSDNSHLYGANVRALSEGVNTAGGVLVPPQFSQTVIRLVEEYGVAAGECQPVPMASDTFAMPRRTGGVTLYALNENSEVTASETNWDAVQLTAKKWGALVKYSAELNEDSTINLADFLATETAWAIAKKQDECLFLGDGSATYQGIVGLKTGLAAGSEVEALTGNTAFSTLDLVDLESMIGKLPRYAENSAKWYISKAGWAASMMRLADAAGGNTAEVIQGERRRTFLGYPVVITQVTNSTLAAQTSTEGLVFFGDMRQTAMLGMRGQMRMKVASERYVEYDQLGFLAFVRFDINCHEVGDASNPGSMIQLNTPSS